MSEQPMPYEEISHPQHYQHPSGIECLTVARHHSFNVGNVLKYAWRAGRKPGVDALTDLKKAAVYLADEIKRIEEVQP